MKTSESITKIMPAIIAAQSNIKHAQKDASNSHFKNNYATLESVIDATKDELLKQKIIVIQAHTASNSLVTTLAHESGEFIQSEMSLIMSKQDMQQLGSATTYARRYAIVSMLNISQEDDDGDGASQPESTYTPKPVENKAPIAPPQASGDYVIQGRGSLKGKALKELSLNVIQGNVTYWQDRSKKENKALTGIIKTDVDTCITYLKAQA